MSCDDRGFSPVLHMYCTVLYCNVLYMDCIQDDGPVGCRAFLVHTGRERQLPLVAGAMALNVCGSTAILSRRTGLTAPERAGRGYVLIGTALRDLAG